VGSSIIVQSFVAQSFILHRLEGNLHIKVNLMRQKSRRVSSVTEYTVSRSSFSMSGQYWKADIIVIHCLMPSHTSI